MSIERVTGRYIRTTVLASAEYSRKMMIVIEERKTAPPCEDCNF